MRTTDFSSSDVNGVVSYKGKPIAILKRKGWTPVSSEPEKVAKAVKEAIFSMPNNASASSLRREIVERAGAKAP
jgi:hypothetical protein